MTDIIEQATEAAEFVDEFIDTDITYEDEPEERVITELDFN